METREAITLQQNNIKTLNSDLSLLFWRAKKTLHFSFADADEGLKFEISVFEYFTVANLSYRPCGW